jgi:hypothetical protein
MKKITAMLFALTVGMCSYAPAIAQPVEDRPPVAAVQEHIELLVLMGRAIESEVFTDNRVLDYVRSQHPETRDVPADGIIAIIVRDKGDGYVNIGLVKDGVIVYLVRALSISDYQRLRSYVVGGTVIPSDQTLDRAYDGIVAVFGIMNSQGGIAGAGR